MIRRIAHHTRGEARPLIPVQEKALSGSATCVAPRFRRNSDTSTQATLKPSCSHGLPKPEGRPRIHFSSLSRFHRNQIPFSVATGLWPVTQRWNLRTGPQGPCLQKVVSKLIGIGKSRQNRI